MLKEITWSEYWKMIIILSLIYEVCIILLFYRKELVLLAKGKRNSASFRAQATAPVENTSYGNEPLLTDETLGDNIDDADAEDLNLVPDAHELAEAIKILIQEAAAKKYAKEEIIFGLQQIIKDYPQLKGTTWQQDINTLINVECKTKCSLHMGAEEIAVLWLGD